MQDSAAATPNSGATNNRKAQRDRATGLAILGAAFLSALLISWVARRAAEPQPAPPPAPPDASGLLSFPSPFDPMSALERARSLSVRPRLMGIVLDGVRSDGTMDLLIPPKLDRAPVRFVFDSPRGEGLQPPRPPGTRLRKTYCGRQDVAIDEKGIYALPDQPMASCQRARDELPQPRCGLKAIWDHALKQGVPADAIAHIEYYHAEAGPAWRFDILGTSHSFVLYGDCERVLTASEALGSIPR